MKILRSCLDEFGTEDNFSKSNGGQLLSREETEEYFNNYIDAHSLADMITFEFAHNTVAPTSVVHSDTTSKVIIGLPIAYRKNRIQGVLDHEIGTHFIRKYNDKKQIWFKKRNKFALQPHIKNEEGLALLNQMTSQALNPFLKPYLYLAAVHYISAIMASELSFSELYSKLAEYLEDKDKRECVRVKRGMTDTSQPGGMYKDQVYLIGAIKVLKYRHQLNFYCLHAGKITVKDCLRLTEKGLINLDKMRIPSFLSNMEQYKRALDRIAEVNFIYN